MLAAVGLTIRRLTLVVNWPGAARAKVAVKDRVDHFRTPQTSLSSELGHRRFLDREPKIFLSNRLLQKGVLVTGNWPKPTGHLLWIGQPARMS
jgi:hypothetical protein